jgi:hypothetical protein
MSEFVKLKEKSQNIRLAMDVYLRATFESEVKELQEACKHEKTHWMQELNKEGDFKAGLFKRCFICGATLDSFEDEKLSELAMDNFDKVIEFNRRPSSDCNNNSVDE